MMSPRNYIEHPWEPSQKIICDVPHVVKCIRNHLKKHTYGMAGDHQINFSHYVALYEAERNKHTRVVPKLTKAHVAPDNLQEISVHLATQVIKGFLDMLNVTEKNSMEEGLKLFASQLTTESLRVTLLSVLDIIEFLLDQGAHYVLTAKLNQDPLERHFGLVRSFGGDESHPTVVNFTQIFRLLSLYTPIKTALRGSVQGVAGNVLVGVQDTLKMTRAVHRIKQASLHGSIQQKLIEMTSDPARTPDQQDDDHCYFKGDVGHAVVYYLSGYVVHKFEKLTACLLCLKDISSPLPVVGSDAYLTTYRSFKEGCMKHPTVKMFTIMKTVNEVVSATLD
ncbi:hypothetical protein V5799_024595 [Amblyomma americanum]|uniref:Transposable element n=1 Tax=Amblyomma americanum TaxID=6943 RepID=A0AAQ4EBK6_AMBAM